MPDKQPVEALGEIEDPILRAYARAHERVVQAQQAILTDPNRWRKRRRLAEVARSIEAVMEGLDEEAADWAANRLPRAYGLGVGAAASETGSAAGTLWTMIQQEAVEELAVNALQNLLEANNKVKSSTKNLIRSIVRDETLQKLIEGDTAVAAGRRVEKLMAENGIHAVTYRDGSRHGLREYSQMTVRTSTATAYNHGFVDGAQAAGVEWFEVFDGICGWEGHSLGPSANGMIVSRDDALSHPISHPNCRRAFGARPDLDADGAKRENSGRKTDPANDQGGAARAQASRAARRSSASSTAGVRPRMDPGKPRGSRTASRDARMETQAAKRGELDLDFPHQATDDVILDSFLANPYKDVPGVQDLLEKNQGWTLEQATKEHKRLKANAASKASKLKAKMKKANETLLDVDVKQAGTSKRPALLHSDKPGARGHVSNEPGNRWFEKIEKDTPEYVPVSNLKHKGVTVKSGIATRRNGTTYLMETDPGEVITQAVKDQFEDNIAKTREALSGLPKSAGEKQRGVAFLRQHNPEDKHWAKQYGIPGFKSSATGGDGSTTFWNTKVTAGTIRHEYGHNLDHAVKGSPLSKTEGWAKATDSDADYRGALGFKEIGQGYHPALSGYKNITEYGAASLDEDFAETVRLYLKDRADKAFATEVNGQPLRFSDIYPERSRFLDEALGLDSKPMQTPYMKHQTNVAGGEVYLDLMKGMPSMTTEALQKMDLSPGTLVNDVRDAFRDKLGWAPSADELMGEATKVSKQLTGMHDAFLKGAKAKADSLKVIEDAKAAAKAASGPPDVPSYPSGLPKDWKTHGVPDEMAKDYDEVLKILKEDPIEGANAVGEWATKWAGTNNGPGFDLILDYPAVHGKGKTFALGKPDGPVVAKAAPKAAPALKMEPAQFTGEPTIAEMKQGLPKNVQASIASKKSKYKKQYLADNPGASAADVAKAVDAVEADEVAKRWRAMNEGQKQMAGASRAASQPTARRRRGEPVQGRAQTGDYLDEERIRGQHFLTRADMEAGDLKDNLVTDIAKRLDTDEHWESLRSFMRDSVNGKVTQDAIQKAVNMYEMKGGMTLAETRKLKLNVAQERAIHTAWRQGYVDQLDTSLLPRDRTLMDAAERQRLIYAQVNPRIQSWAVNSGDSEVQSIWMQMAVKEEFSTTGNPFVAFKPMNSAKTRADIEAGYMAVADWYRSVVRAMYENTQDAFRKDGIDRVSLTRGMSFGDPPPDWAKPGQSRPELMPMNSWTTDRKTAHDFAMGGAGQGVGSYRVHLDASVPVELIIGSARTGFGCRSEWEFVVLDNDGLVTIKRV